MDRRSLLKLIGLAPVAAPVMAQSALASGGGPLRLPANFVPGVSGTVYATGLGRWSEHVIQLQPEFAQTDASMQDDDFNAEFSRWMPDGVEALSATR